MTIEKLIHIERALLEIESRYKFVLPFNDVIRLKTLLDEIDVITDTFISLQDEYALKYDDVDKLREYHDRLINENIDYDRFNAVLFISNVYATIADDDFKQLVDELGILK